MFPAPPVGSYESFVRASTHDVAARQQVAGAITPGTPLPQPCVAELVVYPKAFEKRRDAMQRHFSGGCF
jgi:hypothetical protein